MNNSIITAFIGFVGIFSYSRYRKNGCVHYGQLSYCVPLISSSYSVDVSLGGSGFFESKGTFPEHRIGEPVSVVYSTRNPEMHMLQSDYSWSDLPTGLLYLLSILGFFGGLAVSIVSFLKYRQAIRQPAVTASLPPDVPGAEDLPPGAAAGKVSQSDGHQKKQAGIDTLASLTRYSK